MKALILAAGYATRLYPLTENFPKPLLKVGKETILDRLIDNISSTKRECNEIIVATNNKFFEHFVQWKNTRKELIYIINDNTNTSQTSLGAVRTMLFAIEESNINDDLLVMAGDNILDFSLTGFIDFYHKKNTSCVMCHREDDIKKLQKTAVITLDEHNKVTSYAEKPIVPKGNLAVPPFYIYKKEDIKRIREALNNGCDADAPGSFAAWLSSKTSLHAYLMPGKRYDIGDPKSYEAANKMFSDTY